MDIQQKFNDNLNSILKEKPLKLAVAVSGGADSMALTLLLHNWAMLNKVDMVALTVDHNLRKESAKEALKVNKWLLKYGIKHNILTYTGVVPKSNIEAIARSIVNLEPSSISKYIVENGGAVNSVDVANFTPIMNMICNETMKIDVKCDLIKYLIEKGANINHLNIQRETALNIAIQMLQIKVANILMDAGAFLYE